MIADQFDVFLLDLDGVVYVGDTPLPGARSALRRLREQGKTLRFLTNDPRPTRDDVVDRLERLGIESEAQEVVTCGWATAVYLREAGFTSAYVVGSEGLCRELDRAGLRLTSGNDAEAVVVGCDAEVAYPHVRHGSFTKEPSSLRRTKTQPSQRLTARLRQRGPSSRRFALRPMRPPTWWENRIQQCSRGP